MKLAFKREATPERALLRRESAKRSSGNVSKKGGSDEQSETKPKATVGARTARIPPIETKSLKVALPSPLITLHEGVNTAAVRSRSGRGKAPLSKAAEARQLDPACSLPRNSAGASE